MFSKNKIKVTIEIQLALEARILRLVKVSRHCVVSCQRSKCGEQDTGERGGIQ